MKQETKLVEVKKELIQDIVKIHSKYYERARVQTILYYWELGKRLNVEYGVPRVEENQYVQGHARIGIKGFISFEDSIRQLVKSLKEEGISVCERNLAYARKFHAMYPKIEPLIEEHDMTWTKITSKLLTTDSKIKSEFNSAVVSNFKKWDNLVNEFYKAIPKIDFSKAKKEEKQECIRILKESIRKLQKRVEELEK